MPLHQPLHLIRYVAALLLFAVPNVASPAAARVSCGHGSLRAAYDEASLVVLARIEGAPRELQPVPAGFRGIPDMHHRVIVQRVFKGNVPAGESVGLRWRGFAERIDGPQIGGCMIPGVGEHRRQATQLLVFAQQNAQGEYVVENRSKSGYFVPGENGRRQLRRLRALQRRHGRSR